MTNPSATIQDQIRLPMSVAMEVVLQGIKTRLGRSIVTISGVVLGIAFLMSILAGQLARDGVAAEMRLRADAKRMTSFLTAESGPLRGHIVGMVRSGTVSDVELRFVKSLTDDGAQVRWAGPELPLAKIGEQAAAVVVVGDGLAPEADWLAVMASARQKVVAFARQAPANTAPAEVSFVALSRQPLPDEIEKAAKEARRARFRYIWIVLISLAVTVISISNAMLMSVTERFREIGTMKCLGALSSFIRRIFLFESSLVGAAGGLLGTILGAACSLVIFGFTYGFGTVFRSLDWPLLLLYAVGSIATAIVLSIVAALYPASFAARMVPASALRTNI